MLFWSAIYACPSVRILVSLQLSNRSELNLKKWVIGKCLTEIYGLLLQLQENKSKVALRIRHELTPRNRHLLLAADTVSGCVTIPFPHLTYPHLPLPSSSSSLSAQSIEQKKPPLNLSSKKKSYLFNFKEKSWGKIFTFLYRFVHILTLSLLHLTPFFTEKK